MHLLLAPLAHEFETLLGQSLGEGVHAHAVGTLHEGADGQTRGRVFQDAVDQLEGVAGAALYLLSELGHSVAGEVHHVDAGFHVVGVPDLPED